VRKAYNLPPSCAFVTKSGKLNFLEPFGPVQACNGTALPLPFTSSLHMYVMCKSCGSYLGASCISGNVTTSFLFEIMERDLLCLFSVTASRSGDSAELNLSLFLFLTLMLAASFCTSYFTRRTCKRHMRRNIRKSR